MAEQIVLTDLVNLQNETTAVTAINSNNAVIETALLDVLSLSGIAPNAMQSTLDMNNNQIINLPAPSTGDSPLRLTDANVLNGGGTIEVTQLPMGGTVGQVLEKNSSTNYDVSWQTLPTYVAGPGSSVSGDVVTFNGTTGKIVQDSGILASSLASQSYVTSAISSAIVSSGYGLNILNYGGKSDGVTFNDTALQNAWNALGTHGGTIYFPAGKYAFSQGFSKAMPNGKFCVSFAGDGSGATFLYWPSVPVAIGAAIQLGFQNPNNSVRFMGLSITCGSANSDIGIQFINQSSQYIYSQGQNILFDVMIRPDDFTLGTGVAYWNTCFQTEGVGELTFDTCSFIGQYQGPGGSSVNMTGVDLEGYSSPALYSTINNFFNCNFGYLGIGLQYGTYVQGVIVDSCNFNGETGTYGIYLPTSSANAAGLTVNNCQFNIGGNQIQIAGGIAGALFSNNIITCMKNASIGLVITTGSQCQIVGNVFNITGSPTATTGFDWANGNTGIVSGNSFFDVATGVLLGSGTSAINVQANIYTGATTQVINNAGGSNSIGVASK